MLIVNARLANEGRITEGSLRIRQGRIAAIGPSLAAEPNEKVFDARGRLLMPGMIDDQVHFREPGFPAKGNIASESAAAVAGGITSFFDMPNTVPNATKREVLAQKYTLAAGRAYANYSFYFGGANDNLEEIKRLQPDEACGVKVFMGASTGNMLVDDPKTLEGIFQHCPFLIATHCEDTPTVKANEEKYRAEFGEHVPVTAHPLIRSEECCWKSSTLATGLAKKYGANLHVLHLTTAKELALFEPGNKRITAEVCVHHLFFNDSAYGPLGNRVKCNPAIKREEDRAALVRGVRDGHITLIATDHAPHTAEEKAQPYVKAPSGLPLVQHALPMLFDLAARGELDVSTVVSKTTHAVVERFGIRERGYLREGYFADLTLVDLDAETVVTPESLRYRCAWSPLEGRRLKGRVDATWVNGELAYSDGVLSPQAFGERIHFHQP